MTDLGGGRGWLNPDPAASLFRIDSKLGHRLQVTEAGRTWQRQNEHFQRYLKYGAPIALSPDGPPKGNGPSVHQKGAAIDTDEGQNYVQLLADHGWIRTVYRNGNLVEPWHFEYFKSRDKYYGQGTGAGNQSSALDVATIKKLQTVLGVKADGNWGAGTTTALQNKLIAIGYKIKADGDFGPSTIKALQTFLMGAKNADGDFGAKSITALKNYLNNGGKFSPPATPKPPKEIEVISYHREDKTSRTSGRNLAPGAGFYLHTVANVPASNASNVVGGVGSYSITPHIYGTGTAGDVVEIQLIWQNTKTKPAMNSAHYVERLVVDKDGKIRASREFKRAVAAGYAVYLRVDAPKTNKAAVKITVADVDSYLFVS